MPTLYDRLAVSRGAPAEVIRAAYRVLSQRHHPDRNPDDPSAAGTMQAINDAYAVLSDPARRSAYDASLRRTGTEHGAAGRGHALRQAGSAPRGVHGQPTRRGWAGAVTRSSPARLASIGALLVSGAALVLSQTDRQAPLPARPSFAERPEWRIHGVDTQPAKPPEAASSLPAAPDSASPLRRNPLPASSSPRASSPAAEAPSPSTPAAAAAAVQPGLPIVADPNGRAWPLGAAYVPGLPQTHFDGRSTVVLDNRLNPAPVFVALVAHDTDGTMPVRHVHVPAMGVFRMDSVRPGRYEVQHRNLVTGALTRSGAFEMRQVEGRYGSQASERTVALDPWSAAMALPGAAGL